MIPITTFLLLDVGRIFRLGKFHDDWTQFYSGNSQSLIHFLAQFNDSDRPIYALIFYGFNSIWNGSPIMLSSLSSMMVAITALCIFQFLTSLNKQFCGSEFAPAIATALWIAIPWGLGYSLWPSGSLTLAALCFFLIAAKLMISYVINGKRERLFLIALFLTLSFLTYQAWFLSYLPIIALVYTLTPTSPSKRKNIISLLFVSSTIQAIIIFGTKLLSPKTLAINHELLINNFYYAPLNLIKASFSQPLIFFIFLFTLLAIGLLTIANLYLNKFDITKKRFLSAILACIAGFLISTIPFSLANYGLAGIGVSSRTTVGISFWLIIFAWLFLSMLNKGPKIIVWPIKIGSFIVLASLITSSFFQIKSWELSWQRQNEILSKIPIEILQKIPNAAVILLNEPIFIKGVEVFAAPWDINPAVEDHLKKIGIENPKLHPEFFTFNTGLDWHPNGEVVFDWGYTKKDVSEIWIYTPNESSLVKHPGYGRIDLSLSK